MKHILILFLACCAVCMADTRSAFQNIEIKSSYSELLREKNARNDSLLPALDGDKAFAELTRTMPDLWSLEQPADGGEILTRLNVQIIYIDGIREESFCLLDKDASNSSVEWHLSLGVDFVSAGSNVVGIHVQQCLNMVRDELGYVVRKDGKVVMVPAKKVLDKIKESKIPDELDMELQTKLLKAHESVEFDGKCPRDIEAYLILMDVWNKVSDRKMDLVFINEQLNRKRNGGLSVQSCAFSREWNRRYQERASLECDIDKDLCLYKQSEDGETNWHYSFEENRLEFVGKKFLFFKRGPQSIHRGGTMMDLRIIPLSTRLYLEAYMNLKGEPVSLGLIILPADDEEEWEEVEEE
ncbi:MAG: hypothetical protein LBR60_08540 [Fibrobacter sp.]|nr:hypothetical protein [Fibrobacter sp.]